MSAASSTDLGGTAFPGPGFSICDMGARAHLTWSYWGFRRSCPSPNWGPPHGSNDCLERC